MLRQETKDARILIEESAIHILTKATNKIQTHVVPGATATGQPRDPAIKSSMSNSEFESRWKKAAQADRTSVKKVISGGQTGADRGGLDAGLELKAMGFDIEIGGFCPRGRKSEDGPIPTKYPLIETKSPSYVVRTKRNAESADASLVFVDGGMSGGSLMTVEYLRELGRPHRVMSLLDCSGELARIITAARIREWLIKHEFEVINVAGSRETKCPGVQDRVREFMIEVLR